MNNLRQLLFGNTGKQALTYAALAIFLIPGHVLLYDAITPLIHPDGPFGVDGPWAGSTYGEIASYYTNRRILMAAIAALLACLGLFLVARLFLKKENGAQPDIKFLAFIACTIMIAGYSLTALGFGLWAQENRGHLGSTEIFAED